MTNQESLLYPLTLWYQDEPLPQTKKITINELASIYQKLLAHRNDMTPTLEAHYHGKLGLKLISQHISKDILFRISVLFMENTQKKVQFSGIKIYLSQFAESIQQEIIAAKKPLGTILQFFQIHHDNGSPSFLKIYTDQFIQNSLEITTPQWLYGRHKWQTDTHGVKMTESVEILAPPLFD